LFYHGDYRVTQIIGELIVGKNKILKFTKQIKVGIYDGPSCKKKLKNKISVFKYLNKLINCSLNKFDFATSKNAFLSINDKGK
jgi:hypothetical protein